jgi:hypothetical protein
MARELNDVGKVLSSGTIMNRRVDTERTLGIPNDQPGEVDGKTMHDDLIFLN